MRDHIVCGQYAPDFALLIRATLARQYAAPATIPLVRMRAGQPRETQHAKDDHDKQRSASHETSKPTIRPASEFAPRGERAGRAPCRGATKRAPLPDDDPVPDDIDAFRLELARRIMTLLGMARRCRAPACRRMKRCVGPDLRCQRDFPAPRLSEERQSEVMASVHRLVKRRLAELGAL